AFLPASVLPARLDRIGIVALAGQPLAQEWYLIRLRERAPARVVDLIYETMLGDEGRAALLRLGLAT
ncbi:MAG: LysR family transcriptional regulator, partial [Chloroflexus sp.]|nr:LysR family transcriptional regulator [Chloroflexus sp.]